MRKVEVKILKEIREHEYYAEPWEKEITSRDRLDCTKNGIIHYSLYNSMIISIIPSGVTYRNKLDKHFSRIALKCGKWKTKTTLSRFNAFLSYYVGAVMYEKAPVKNPHTMKNILNAKWFVDGPDIEEPIEYVDYLEFRITRDGC